MDDHWTKLFGKEKAKQMNAALEAISAFKTIAFRYALTEPPEQPDKEASFIMFGYYMGIIERVCSHLGLSDAEKLSVAAVSMQEHEGVPASDVPEMLDVYTSLHETQEGRFLLTEGAYDFEICCIKKEKGAMPLGLYSLLHPAKSQS